MNGSDPMVIGRFEFDQSRTALLIGSEAVERLALCKVAVFGIGGVGSFAVEALARAGIGRFVLIDSDQVAPSNLNRQILALQSTIGRLKVDVMRERILDINPAAVVETHAVFCQPGSADLLLTADMDYVIDAIDTVSAKLDLIVTAKAMSLPVISCMGAGNKLDPTRFEVADIYQTSVCPLGKVIRRELKKRGINSLKVVYSKEQPVVSAHVEREGEGATADGNLQETRGKTHKRVPGSISFVPSAAGLILAGEVIKDLIR